MKVTEQIDAWISQNALVGFSPWRDGDGLLYGYIRSRKGKAIVVDAIDPLGQPDGQTQHHLDKIAYFSLDEAYIERLKRLATFRPSAPDEKRFVRARERVESTLRTALTTGEPVSVRLRFEVSPVTATVTGLQREWVEVAIYDELMSPKGKHTVRTDMVTGVRIGTVSEEADAFLLARKASGR